MTLFMWHDMSTPLRTQSQQPSPAPARDSETLRTFIRTFFGVQLELLHQKIHDPQSLPSAVQQSLLEDATLGPRRLHQLLTHWTMFAQPMVQFEQLPAQPGQASWDRLLDLAMHAYNCHSSPTPEDQRNFAIHVVTQLTDWLCDGWQAYERNQAQLPWHGCFRYEVNDQGVAALHFYNAVCPASPFDHLPQRAAELQTITHELLALKNVHTVRMASWLNSLPVVQQLFPPSYVASIEPNGPYPNGLGWWGQLITRQGNVHPLKARQIREQKGFTYPRCVGYCPLKDMPS